MQSAITEQDWLASIQARPDDLSILGPYSDWLEEQGNPKATNVRAFCENRLDELSSIKEVLRQLSGQHQRQCACEFAWLTLPLYEQECPDDNRPRDALITAWRHALGDATQQEAEAAWDAARGSIRGAVTVTVGDAATVVLIALWAVTDAAETAAMVAAETAARVVAKEDLLRIAASYLLFGCNLCPGRFTLEEALKGCVE